MGDHPASDRPSSSPAPARATVDRDDLRGRRREAIDLLVPGRGAARIRRHAARTSTSFCAGDRAGAAICAVPPLVPLGPTVLGAGRHGVRAAAGACAGYRPTRSGRCTKRCRTPRPAWSKSGTLQAERRSARSKPGMRRSTNSTETSPQVRLAREDRRASMSSAAGTEQGARAGDVLVLVRQRGALFEAIIRALKDADVAGRRRRPAGADRAHRGHGPDGAGRRAAAAARTISRSRPC